MLPAYAQDATREEVRKLQQRVDELDKRVQDAENAAAQAQQQASSRPQSEGAFNPAVSAILNGVYANLSQDPNGYRINGFVPTMGEVAPPRRGFSLGESELGIAANVDHLFRGTLIASISPDDNSVGVEEAYIQTLALTHGFSVKAGRFFSAVGYQNQIHAHAWDFTDAPLVLKAFLGGQLHEDGVQVKWVAPTELYFDLGAEFARGLAFPAAPANKNGAGSVNAFTHLGGDIGESLAWQGGLSYYQTSPDQRAYDDPLNGITNSFTGRSKLWALSGILKWAPNGNTTSTNFKLQGEYFQRKEDGDLTFDPAGAALTDGYASKQSGWYLQGAYQFMPQWRVGYRYDELSSGTTSIGLVNSGALAPGDLPILAEYKPKRHTAMVDWSPSEFSRVRLQLARDYSRMGEPDNQVFLQYIVSLGAHGAHTF
jgi:tetrahydromethanopterin S-methyltransferase subunit B